MNASSKFVVPGATRDIADFAATLQYRDIPDDLILNAKQCIRDSLGCAVFGAPTPWVQAVVRTVGLLGQKPSASAWGMKVKADPLGAAFINGTAAQGYELDDCHDQSMSHYGAGVVPAVIACSEGAFGAFTGKDMIRATVAGYELGTRIGNTVSPSAFHRGFHPCGLTSTFGSAAAIAKLLDLDTDRYVSALGLAGSQAAGLMASQFGAMAKRFHSGKASQNGIIAALCAREGLTGVRDVLEAPYGGFCSTYSAEYDLSFATDGLGTDWEMRRNGFKRYSSLASSQTTVDALRAIREKAGIRGEDVEKVRVGTTEMVFVHCGWPYVPNGETISAQMNLPYTGAVTLLEGNAFIDQYTDEKLTDPKIIDLANRIEVYVDPELDAREKHQMRAVRVTVTMKDGTEHFHEQTYRSGHWRNPMSDEVLKEKFRDLASRQLTGQAVAEIERIIDNLENEEAPAIALGAALQQVR
ncbi:MULTISPECIES: MmgE/PrpD family protein [Sphingobium]|uniref:MmgE/PrpD family protein n=1 Tax=Sphingobium fuliginis (strain ATCC 27551) TaxID=336203 RepID=A0ABQ1EXY1_SPHSA|nr:MULTISPECIES: MmgE/PrpD family protein [Sphingobium]RYL98034.1 MmgE/PrpD family protein [Sphingobium fuliginis]WDA34742.1 MmgE/PrpD family protein [Sphingobium sp. YC-XJ3]GFZ92499.1 MmgE/PrpD family protein [Sphingobium fuliginis]